ncbi:hypothetical protein Y032_1572g3919, partial [Ancylostoma ceylanicum]
MRFCRLPFGINASPFLLAISIKHGVRQQKGFSEAIMKELESNLYVDNVMMTDVSTDSLIEKYSTCKRIFLNMSMNLRQFITNDEECNKNINKEDLSKARYPKILGIPWNPREDTMSLRCKLRYSENPTKRKVLQAVHLTFDPLGYLTPLLLPAKVFLQELWKREYSWDDPLSAEDDRDWKAICENATSYVTTISRSMTKSYEDNRYEINTCVDASNRSYAAVVYLRIIDQQGNITSSLVMARQRLAPLKEKGKTLTIPRLELLALLIGTRLSDFVLKEIGLPITEVRIYSDSKVALQW